MENNCNYSQQWQPYIGDYDKFEYDIKLRDGRVITNCYPNARKFMSFHPSTNNKTFAESDVVEIRFTPRESAIVDINPDELYN